ncbi:MAG: hypothetical protein ACT4OU_03530 [Hyphomicrobium sp.]
MTTGNQVAIGYHELMQEGTPFVELRICLTEPTELVSLVESFAAVANQFDVYLRREHPNLKGAAKLFVQDIRKGSIIVELLPIIQPLIANMDNTLIVDGFVRRFGGRIKQYIEGKKDDSATKGDIKDLMGAVGLIANDPDGKSAISSVEYRKTKTTTRLTMEFDTEGAKKARETLQLQKAAIDLPAYEVFENKLMVFVQTTVKSSDTGKKTNQQAIIEAIHPKPLGITFETDLARERVESEIREDEKNVYKKGFFVDCYTERLNGKPVAYRITAVRDIIPLPDDDA